MEYSPRQLATKRRDLALEYKKKLEELAGIRNKKALEIIRLLDEHKTVSKAELYWRASEQGQRETTLELYTKGLLETMRAVKTEVEIMNGEAFNQY